MSTSKPQIELRFSAAGMGHWWGFFVPQTDADGSVLLWSYSATEGPMDESIRALIEGFVLYGAVTVYAGSEDEYRKVASRIRGARTETEPT